MMKKASVVIEQSCASVDDAEAKLRFQTRLNDYLEMQKEYVSRKKKLQAAKRKKEKILALVRFLRQKRKYLLKSQEENIKNVSLHLPNSDVERNQSTSEVAPKKSEQVFSNAHQKTGENKDVRFKPKIKNHSVCRNSLSNRNTGLPDQVDLNV